MPSMCSGDSVCVPSIILSVELGRFKLVDECTVLRLVQQCHSAGLRFPEHLWLPTTLLYLIPSDWLWTYS